MVSEQIHRVGLVGIGKVARDQHMPCISQNPDFKLAATASRNANVGGVDAFNDLEGLLRGRPDVDCVVLCTPPHVRYNDARRAIAAGRHVLLEKPPGATVSEVLDLAELARQNRVTLFATWHSRFAHCVASARRWLRDKTIHAVDVIWKEDVRRWHPGQQWIWEEGGLGVFDPGINALSILTDILPRKLHLVEAALSFPKNRATPIAADLKLEDNLGVPVSAAFDWRQEGHQTWDITVKTDAGILFLSEGGARLALDGKELDSGPDREYAGIYHAFSDLIARRESDVDLQPMILVADAYLLGQRIVVEPFVEMPEEAAKSA